MTTDRRRGQHRTSPVFQALLRRLDPWLVAAAALALIPIAAIAQPGIPHTADGMVHILRTLEVSRLLAEGVLYPRWAPDFYLGYGYPFFNFYAPGAHLLAAGLSLAGLGVLRGVVAVQVIALLLYPVGAYLAARSLFTTEPGAPFAHPAALVSAALYLYAPLRFRELFTQGNLSQLLALALLPWCAWLLAEAVRRADLRWSTAAGVVLATLVYAHHPSAFLGFPFLAVYTLALALIAGEGLRSARARRGLAAGIGAFVLGVLLSAPFWLPSIVELRDVNISSIEAGMFNARLNLLPLNELLSPARILDDAALNPVQPNSLGIAQVVLALGGLGVALVCGLSRSPGAVSSPALWTRRQMGQTLLVAAGLLIFSLVAMLPLAGPAWERLPLVRFIAFPWRLLGPALLWSALLGGAALFIFPSRARIVVALVLLILIPLAVAPYLFPRPFAAIAEPRLADIARYELSEGARATASANEYLPRWVADPNPPQDLAEAERQGAPLDRLDRGGLPPSSQVERLGGGLLEDRYRIDLPAAATVVIRRFYFPGWAAWVDGQQTPITPSAPFGFIAVAVGPGAHELRVSFGPTPARIAGDLLAVIGLVTITGMSWASLRRRAGSSPRPNGRTDGRRALVALGAVLALTATVTLLVGPRTRWFRARSSVEAPSGMQRSLHTRFANGIELIGYDLPEESGLQGGTLGVRLYWQALEPQHSNVRPFLHLDAITRDETWANQTKTHPGDKPSTSWPPGFYVVDEYRLALPADMPPVVALLRAGLLDERGELVPLVEGGDQATLGTAHVRERRPLDISSLPGSARPYRLGDLVQLVGYSMAVAGPSSADASAGLVLDVTLYWQAEDRPPTDYTVFVHVLDSRGERIAQGDGPPSGGRYPSSQWTPGQIVKDARRVSLPKDTNPADLLVVVGLYTPTDGARLIASDARGARLPDDQIPLGFGGR